MNIHIYIYIYIYMGLRQNSDMDRPAVIQTYGSVWVTCILVLIGGMDRSVGSGYGSGLSILTRSHIYIYIHIYIERERDSQLFSCWYSYCQTANKQPLSMAYFWSERHPWHVPGLLTLAHWRAKKTHGMAQHRSDPTPGCRQSSWDKWRIPTSWMVDFMENPTKMDDDWGYRVPPWMETPIL